MTSTTTLRWIFLAVVGAVVLAAALCTLLLPGTRSPQPSPVPSAPVANQPVEAEPAPETTPARHVVASTERAGSVQGRVVDAEGEPMAGAWVGEVASDRPARTTADGRFALPRADGEETITLLVIAPGHAARLSSHPLAGDVIADVGDVEVLPGGGLRGRITDPSGAGLQGATVSLRMLSRGEWPDSIDLEALQPPATTATGGDFVFSCLVPGSYALTATAPGRQEGRALVTVVEARTIVVDPISLAVGFALVGVVRDGDDQPVVGATVELRSGQGQPRFADRTATGADGRFGFASLPAGPLHLQVRASGYLRTERADVDPTNGAEVVVRMVSGLRLFGTVVDRDRGRPVERYAAAVKRVGDLAPDANGTMRQQLERQLAALRTETARRGDERTTALIGDLEERLSDLVQQSRPRPAATVGDLGPPADHPDGAFSFEGLEEGLYAVLVDAPDHQAAESETVELRRDAPPSALRLVLAPGHDILGVVVGERDGEPIAGAQVTLVRLWGEEPAETDDGATVPSWAFAGSRATGVTLRTATTSADGRFALRHAEPGRYVIAVDHPRFVHDETPAFDLPAGHDPMRVAMAERATLLGHVRGVRDAAVEVVAIGGHGALERVAVAPGGGYRIELLPPGGYVVRAFDASDAHYVDRLLGRLFPQRVGERDPAQMPVPDVTLVGGETRALDLDLDLPPAGSVAGTVTINGRPERDALFVLRPEDPAAGGVALRVATDDSGSFRLDGVPAGSHTFTVYGRSRQPLIQRSLSVTAETTAVLRLDLDVGTLRGQILANDGAAPDDLAGAVWVLPGADAAPDDLHAYRREARTQRVRVRRGAFEDDCLSAGPAILVLDLHGRSRTSVKVTIPAGGVLSIELEAGARQ